jgi:hypothetical protein
LNMAVSSVSKVNFIASGLGVEAGIAVATPGAYARSRSRLRGV